MRNARVKHLIINLIYLSCFLCDIKLKFFFSLIGFAFVSHGSSALCDHFLLNYFYVSGKYLLLVIIINIIIIWLNVVDM